MLYQEGWGVESIKHSLTYSGGLQPRRACAATPARAARLRRLQSVHSPAGHRASPRRSRSPRSTAGLARAAVRAQGRDRRARRSLGARARDAGLSQAPVPARVSVGRRGRAALPRQRRSALPAATSRRMLPRRATVAASAARERSPDPDACVPAKPHVDPWRPTARWSRTSAAPDGSVERALTVFLAGAECPFTCSFCDLWRLHDRRPDAARALARAAAAGTGGRGGRTRPARPDQALQREQLLRPRAVPAPGPAGSWPRWSAPFAGVTVESHASTDRRRRCCAFARAARRTARGRAGTRDDPPGGAAAPQQARSTSRASTRAAALLRQAGIDLRVFVLLGAPFVPAEESVEWTVRTVEHAALEQGARVVAIIPVRGGNGEMERLGARATSRRRRSRSSRPRSSAVCAPGAAASSLADLWDAERLAALRRRAVRRAIERLRVS